MRRHINHLKGHVIFCANNIEVLQNTPELWVEDFPFPEREKHKYDRGHAVVAGGGLECTGASKLAAMAALRIGAGLVTVASPKEALEVYAKCLTSVMAKPYEDDAGFEALITGERRNAVLVGPGNGVNEATKKHVLSALKLRKKCVIDADAITVFQDEPEVLFKAVHSAVVLTPHEGEFKRIFSVEGNRLERTMQAARQSRCVVVLKGAETVIAASDGRVIVNDNAPPWLATAGSGDVLAGIITGLLAGGMKAFEAACAAVWIHGEAANIAGLGMIAEDLPDQLPRVLRQLKEC